jgi:carboxypeptidase PM20D1
MIAVYIILALLMLLVIVLAVNTVKKKPQKTAARGPEPLILDKDKLAENLSGMIRYKTITSLTMEGFDKDAFLGLHAYIEKTYPLLHRTLQKEVVNTYSLLYKWTGSGSDKKPFLMMGHMDVVPVDERTKDKWTHEAFSGAIADGYVWGRGAIDMKGQVAAVLESVEYLIGEGYVPKRDIYIAIGHDEEAMGTLGAQKIVDRLSERGVHFDFVIDEGGVMMDGKLMNVDAMVAAVGICEKGYADLRLIAESAGGHASRPPKQTAVGALAKAIVALEKHHMKPTLNKPLKDMLDALGGYMKFPLNVIASNLFLTKPLLIKGLGTGSTGAAMVRTTAAPTMLQGSGAPNTLAERAEAVVNFRISPDDTVDDLLKHIKKTVGEGIKLEVIQAYEPSGVSSTDSEAYRIIKDTIHEAFPEYVVSPYLMVGATDSRRYAAVADGIYRFQPFRSMADDVDTIHAANERLHIDSLREGVAFFVRLVKKADGW